MRRRITVVRVTLWLFWAVLFWAALWVRITPGTLVAGLLVGLATLWVVPFPEGRPRVPIRPLAAARFGVFFLWELVKASATVAWEVVTPGNSIREGVVEVPLRHASVGMITLVGNAVSLTPGTLTIEARQEPPTLWVHVLHLRSPEETRRDIARLEEIAARAFVPGVGKEDR